jgi:hypothetical protein
MKKTYKKSRDTVLLRNKKECDATFRNAGVNFVRNSF